MALPTLVNVTPVPGNISKGEVCAAPIWILFAIVVAIPADTFTVGFTSAYDGQFYISLGSTQTRDLPAGRYEYNVLMTPSKDSVAVLDTSIAVGATAGIGTT